MKPFLKQVLISIFWAAVVSLIAHQFGWLK